LIKDPIPKTFPGIYAILYNTWDLDTATIYLAHLCLALLLCTLSAECKEKLNKRHTESKDVGIHMHMGDGSINKSGTSAGIAITILLYSLLSNRKIRHDYATTGEASDLNGKVGEIGALRYKFIGEIKAGVKHLIFPENNSHEYHEFIEKYKNNPFIDGVTFHPVSHIIQVIELIVI